MRDVRHKSSLVTPCDDREYDAQYQAGHRTEYSDLPQREWTFGATDYRYSRRPASSTQTRAEAESERESKDRYHHDDEYDQSTEVEQEFGPTAASSLVARGDSGRRDS